VSSSEAAHRRLGMSEPARPHGDRARSRGGGYDVGYRGRGRPKRIELVVEVLAPGARALSTDEVVRSPISSSWRYDASLPGTWTRLFAGKILVDAMNYWENRWRG